MARPIANEITGDDQDSYCSVCGDDTLVVRIQGKPYEDSEIFLCQHCLARMLEEINNMGIVQGDTSETSTEDELRKQCGISQQLSKAWEKDLEAMEARREKE